MVWPAPRPAEVVDADGRRVAVSGRGIISAPPSEPDFKYWGGPELKQVKVVEVLWGPAVDLAADLGQFYAAITDSEYFDVLGEYAEAPNGIRGTHPTPTALADLMAELATTTGTRVHSILDPACGGGRLLAAAATRLNPGARVHGQEYRLVAAAQARARLAEAAPKASVDVRTGDSLRDDAFPGLRVESVVCNPPYGDREWRRGNRVFKSDADAQKLWRSLDRVVDGQAVVYADPPYSKEHYSRYYHVLETLERYDYPEATGVGRYRPDRFRTPFSVKTEVEGAIRRLPAGRAPLPVIEPTAAEQAAHEAMLARLRKASGKPVEWA